VKKSNLNALRIFLSVLLSIFLFSNSIIVSRAASTINLSIGNASAQFGQEVIVPINLQNVTTLSAFNFYVKFDSTRLELIQVLPGSIIPNSNDFDYGVTGDTITFLYDDGTGGDNPIINNGELALLKFRVKSNAKAGMAFVERVANTAESFGDKDLNRLTANWSNGYISVDDGNSPRIVNAWLDTDVEGLRINAQIDETNRRITLKVPSVARILTRGYVQLSEDIYSARFVSEVKLPNDSYEKTLYNLSSDTLSTKLNLYFGNNTPKSELLKYNGATLELKDYVGNTKVYTFNIYEENIQPIEVVVSEHVAAEDTYVDLTVSLNNVPNVGISAADFALTYDSSKFVVESITRGDIIKSSEDFDYQITNGKITFLFSDESIDDSRAIKKNGVFATIRFRVLNTNKVGIFNINISNVGSFVSPNLVKYAYTIDQGYIDVFKYGDVNGDGKVASDDYAAVKSYILGRINIFPYRHGLISADVNKDNTVTSLDYIAIKKFILGKITKFPIE